MKLPDHNPAPDYVRALIEQCKCSQREAARRINVGDREVRYWTTGQKKIPYDVQIRLELLALQEKYRILLQTTKQL